MTIKDIFVAMPFGIKQAKKRRYKIDFDRVYDKAIRPATEELGLQVIRADEEQDGGIIHTLMIERLICTDIVIVDITNENPNVYYELGIRHCARPYSTILIYDKNTRLPFDIQPLRAIPYELDKGVITEKAAIDLKDKLVERLKNVISCDCKCDSLPFALIDNFPKTELDDTKLHIYQDLQKQRNIFKSQLEKIEDINNLYSIIKSMQDTYFPFKYLIFEIIKGFQKIKAWNELLDFIHNSLDNEVKNYVYVRQQEALAYNKRGQEGDEKTSLFLLEEILKDYGESSETYGLIGSAYKKLAMKFQETISFPSYLEKAINAYRNGFEMDSRNYYTGINLATLLLVQNKDEAEEELTKILPVITYNIELNDFSISNDYWLLATAYELYILNKDFAKAENVLGIISTLQTQPSTWMYETTIKNLTLIKKVYENYKIKTDWFDMFITVLKIKEI